MALTIFTNVSDGSKVLYDVPFTLGYIREEFVYVYLDGNDYTNQLSYTWMNSTQIQLDSPVPVGQTFYIRRVVERNAPVNDYVDGAIVREENLDTSFLQALMLFEEVEDGFMSVLPGWVVNSSIDMQGNLIKNLGQATDEDDAVTVKYVQELVAALSTFDPGTADALGIQLVNQHVVAGYTLPTNRNGISVNPIVDVGVNVVIPLGAEWVILGA